MKTNLTFVWEYDGSRKEQKLVFDKNNKNIKFGPCTQLACPLRTNRMSKIYQKQITCTLKTLGFQSLINKESHILLSRLISMCTANASE